jgi:hypothetical protein
MTYTVFSFISSQGGHVIRVIDLVTYLDGFLAVKDKTFDH